MLQLKFREDPGIQVVALSGLWIVFCQFGMICFFGQRLTTQSANLLDASYECNWIDQSKHFKFMLVILRIVCLKQLKMGMGRFDFSFATFYQVSQKMMVNDVIIYV